MKNSDSFNWGWDNLPEECREYQSVFCGSPEFVFNSGLSLSRRWLRIKLGKQRIVKWEDWTTLEDMEPTNN